MNYIVLTFNIEITVLVKGPVLNIIIFREISGKHRKINAFTVHCYVTLTCHRTECSLEKSIVGIREVEAEQSRKRTGEDREDNQQGSERFACYVAKGCLNQYIHTDSPP
jgi:hypothetical protein